MFMYFFFLYVLSFCTFWNCLFCHTPHEGISVTLQTGEAHKENENASLPAVPVYRKVIEGAVGSTTCWNSFGHKWDRFHGELHYVSLSVDNNKNDCHFKNTHQSDFISVKPILGAWTHICVKYETSMIRYVFRRVV